MVNFSAALTAFLLLAGSNTALAQDTTYSTTAGEITCSGDNYAILVGFPANTKCKFSGNRGCNDIGGATFTAGELKGQKVFPTAISAGWKIKGNPGETAPKYSYASAKYKLKNGPQSGHATGFTGQVSKATELAATTWSVNVDSGKAWIAYQSQNWVPGAVIMQGADGANVYVPHVSQDGQFATADGYTPPEGETTEVEFCLSVGSEGANPDPDPNPNPNPNPSSGGDPHFKTWNGQKFDFHGGCDLVLLQNAGFNHGLGLDVHIRTKIESSWSFIDTAAVRLGDHTLEIAGDLKQIPYWLDGVQVANMETGAAALGDYAIHFRRINDHQSQTRLDLGNGNALSIETYKHFVRVNIKASSPDAFNGTYGMLGSYPAGQKVARDMATVIDDDVEFGKEWQVLAKEAKLFHSESAVQHPNTCLMPDETQKSQSRRLGESMISEEDAALACGRVAEEDRDACIFDVIATNDKDMAGSY